jgi:hypothetical protein
MKTTHFALAAALASGPALASAQEPDAPPPPPAMDRAIPAPPPAMERAAPPAPPTVVVVVPDLPAPEPPSHPDVNLGVGMRAMLLPSVGLDPYSSNDFLAMSALTAGLTVARFGRASITLSGEWNVGTRNGMARGQDTSLTLHRLAGVAETRYQLGRRFFLAVKVSPAAFHARATLADTSIERPLVARSWTWSLEAAGGVGLLLGSTGRHGAKFWLNFDLGYTFAGETKMDLSPAADDQDPRRYGTVAMPALRPSGATSRLGLFVAF